MISKVLVILQKGGRRWLTLVRSSKKGSENGIEQRRSWPVAAAGKCCLGEEEGTVRGGHSVAAEALMGNW